MDILQQESSNNNDLIFSLCDYGINSDIPKNLLFKVFDIKMLKCWYSDEKKEGILCILKMLKLLKYPEVKNIFDGNINYYLNNFEFFTNYFESKINK
jgi:hypothetical protein